MLDLCCLSRAELSLSPPPLTGRPRSGKLTCTATCEQRATADLLRACVPECHVCTFPVPRAPQVDPVEQPADFPVAIDPMGMKFLWAGGGLVTGQGRA